MKILAVADKVEHWLYEHFDRTRIQGVDLLISCGDLPPEYLTFLRERVDVPLLYVQGNHDIRYRESPPVGCTDIHGRVMVWNGYRILGLSGCRWYNGGPNQFREGQMRQVLRRLWFTLFRLRGIDIVVTHAPPRHVHDAEDRCHRGFASYRHLIAKYAPLYFFHGHIHTLFTDPAERVTKINTTRVINCYGSYTLDL